MVEPCIANIQTLLKLLDALRQMLLVVQRRMMQEINLYVSYKEMCLVLPKTEQKKILQDIDLPQVDGRGRAVPLKYKVQNAKAGVKALFEKTVSALDLFGNYIEAPSEETSEKLKQLCVDDSEKSTVDELLTTHEMDEAFDFLRSFLIDETKKSQDSNHESFSSDKHSVLQLSFSANSASRKASEKKLELKFEKRCELNSNEKQQRGKEQFATTHNQHDKFQKDFMHSSRPRRKSLNTDHGSFNSVPTTIENCYKGDIFYTASNISEEAKRLNLEDLGMNDYETEETPTTQRALKKEVYLLKVKNQELMAELGQVMVEKTAKEREVRKFEFFQQIYHPSLTEVKQSVVSTSNDTAATEYDTLGYPNDNDSALRLKSSYANENASTSNRFETSFSKATNENVDPTSLVPTAVSSKQVVQGAESLVKEDDDQPGKKEIVTQDRDEGELHDGDQNGVGILTDNNENENPETQTSSEEGIDQSGNVTGTSNEASTSREGNIEQSSTLQSYESLSFLVRQDYSTERENISLSNVPPTSVATTLYNNYKLLLLSLGQMLLSSDVTKLMTWATQNFPIVNPQNATHVLFQLDENEVINPSDLSQLRHFFESIARFDLVHVIDAFLLGDYGILRQITTSNKRDVSAQTPQNGATTRHQNLFSAASTSQFSLRGSSLRAENSNEPQSSVLHHASNEQEDTRERQSASRFELNLNYKA